MCGAWEGACEGGERVNPLSASACFPSENFKHKNKQGQAHS